MGIRAYVASTEPGQGATAHHYLDRAGFVACLLSVKEFRGDRLVSCTLFPGYIFVWFDIEIDAWQRVNRTRGIARLLPVYQEEPRPLPIGFVEELREAAEGGRLDARLADETVGRYAPGDMVRVRAGTFALQTLPLSRYEKGSLLLWTSLLGKKLEVTVPLHHVEPASRKAA